MANPDHLKILKQGVEVWNRWREDTDCRPDLIGADLSCADLRGARLREGDLSGANLRNANLDRSDLRDTDLSGSNFQCAWLRDTLLIDALLIDANLSRADLSYASLIRANLSGAFLTDANLMEAKLSDAKLSGAKLSNANLCDADLRGAYLIHARFRDTNLVRSNLSGAYLMDSDLSGADLHGADLRRVSFSAVEFIATELSNSKMGRTSLVDLDLSATKGLSEVEHFRASSIAIDTLYKSRGKIPEIFLRGVGLPEAIIDYLPSLVAQSMIESCSCFISYSHSDKPFARRLHDQLQAYRIRCWLDEHDLKPGDRILDVVNNAIRLHDKILLCCSETSLNSWWVKDEIRKAQLREQKEGRMIIIPLNLDGYLFQWNDGLASDLTTRLAADFEGWEHDNAKFEDQFERVVKALKNG